MTDTHEHHSLERHRGAIRFALIYMAIAMGSVALYILLAPRTFYDDFPGWAQWVSALPPYNEHLLRDFGSAGLGLAVLAALAGVWLDRRLVQAAAIVLFVGNLPHTIYHFTTTESYSTERQRRQPGRPRPPMPAAPARPLPVERRAPSRTGPGGDDTISNHITGGMTWHA